MQEDNTRIMEENLREAAALGDLRTVQELIAKGVNVNSKNTMNGWTPLHWACKRGHEPVVRYLLGQGADSMQANHDGKTPIDVCSNPCILYLLGVSGDVINNQAKTDASEFVPNYLRHHQQRNHHGKLVHKQKKRASLSPTSSESSADEIKDLVLKIRIANDADPDYIEVELSPKDLTFNKLLKICCDELYVVPNQVERIRKMPDTRIRSDRDVKRLHSMQRLELVLRSEKPTFEAVEY